MADEADRSDMCRVDDDQAAAAATLTTDELADRLLAAGWRYGTLAFEDVVNAAGGTATTAVVARCGERTLTLEWPGTDPESVRRAVVELVRRLAGATPAG